MHTTSFLFGDLLYSDSGSDSHKLACNLKIEDCYNESRNKLRYYKPTGHPIADVTSESLPNAQASSTSAALANATKTLLTPLFFNTHCTARSVLRTSSPGSASSCQDRHDGKSKL